MRARFALIVMLACLMTAGCWTQRVHEQKALVINVLDKALYDDCHIPGSIQVDFDKVDAYVSVKPKDLPIVVYCSNYACTTSHFVAKRLLSKGYTNVHVYSGGMAEWFQMGYPVEGPAQAGYLYQKVALAEENLGELPTIRIKDLAELLKIV